MLYSHIMHGGASRGPAPHQARNSGGFPLGQSTKPFWAVKNAAPHAEAAENLHMRAVGIGHAGPPGGSGRGPKTMWGDAPSRALAAQGIPPRPAPRTVGSAAGFLAFLGLAVVIIGFARG